MEDQKNEMPEKFQAFADLAIKGAKDNLENSGDIMPVFFVIGATDQVHIVGAHWRDEREKDAASLFVRQLVHKEAAKSVIFVCESWFLDKESADDFMKNRSKYRQVSDHPGKKEAVLITVETMEGTFMAMAPIIRGDKKATFNEKVPFKKADGSSGRMTNFLGLPKKT